MKSIAVLSLLLAATAADDSSNLRGLSNDAVAPAKENTKKFSIPSKDIKRKTVKDVKFRAANTTEKIAVKEDVPVVHTATVDAPAVHTLAPAEPGAADEFGYLIEFTRTNTDCTGQVLSIAGIVTGASNYATFDSGAAFWQTKGPPTVVKSELKVAGESGTYSYLTRVFEDADASTASIEDFAIEGKQCATVPDGHEDVAGFIPYSLPFLDHGGYFYSHKYTKGTFKEAVSSQYSGAYQLYFESLTACKLGVQPVAFYASLIKGQCYFDPTYYDIVDTFSAETKVHSWVKVEGYDTTAQSLKYTIHNNNDCVDWNPYDKAKPQWSTSAATHVALDESLLGKDCYQTEDFRGGWTKNIVF